MKFGKYLMLLVGILFLGVGFISQNGQLPTWLSPQGMINPESIDEEYDPAANFGYFNNKPVGISSYRSKISHLDILGDFDANVDKRIEIDLTTQKLFAVENNQIVYEFPISSGKWGRTPTGTFSIWIKLRYVKMEGGSKALNTYYNLPNVPYTMFFYNEEIPKSRGYGIHGAYWHNNFGHPMSHGCINMRTEDVEQLYYWANPELLGKSSIKASDDNPGTQVIIYGTAPLE